MADVFKRTTRTRVYLTKNELTRHDLEYLTSEVTFTELSHQRAVLATNMATPQEVDISNVGTAAVVMVTNDRPVTLFVNTTTNGLSLGTTGMFMMVGTVTHIYVQNASTTYTATIEVLATD